MPLSASHPLARHAPEHWPGIGWNAGPASPESALSENSACVRRATVPDSTKTIQTHRWRWESSWSH